MFGPYVYLKFHVSLFKKF